MGAPLPCASPRVSATAVGAPSPEVSEARNVEVKAWAFDFEAQTRVAASMAGEPPVVVKQEDTFFHAANGRLKLREFGDGTGELIHYHRPDSKGPKRSTYVRSHTTDPCRLKETLARALGIRAIVKKTRRVVLTGQTRIHLDEVAGLGDFIEIEVVLRPEQTVSEGVIIAEKLMAELGIERRHLVPGSYVDLLAEEKPNTSVEPPA
ncbi:class IV adenylate cyclase [Candidatus Fermentibacteria bacterium]|nr:class IV adenylate cyclase [Candidatus Fermentibacteria bacterium]